MMPVRAGELVSTLAFACVTVGFLRDALAEAKAAPGHPGLPWSRAGTLGLWVGLALRSGIFFGDSLPVSWLNMVPILAFTALLHLIHVQGWKGARARRAGLGCWALSAAAFGLAAFG